MNGLSDSLTIGLVLALVFGALFFYVYSRIGQVEKRVSLTENILLDLKIATENTLMAMSGGPSHHDEHDHEVGMGGHDFVQIQATSAPEPLKHEDSEQIPDDDFYKAVLQNEETAKVTKGQDSTVLHSDESGNERSGRLDVNYESMTLKELKALAKQRGVNTTSMVHKKDFIDALKRQGQPSVTSVLEPVPGSQGVSNGGLEEGFPVEMGATGSA